MEIFVNISCPSYPLTSGHGAELRVAQEASAEDCLSIEDPDKVVMARGMIGRAWLMPVVLACLSCAVQSPALSCLLHSCIDFHTVEDRQSGFSRIVSQR